MSSEPSIIPPSESVEEELDIEKRTKFEGREFLRVELSHARERLQQTFSRKPDDNIVGYLTPSKPEGHQKKRPSLSRLHRVSESSCENTRHPSFNIETFGDMNASMEIDFSTDGLISFSAKEADEAEQEARQLVR